MAHALKKGSVLRKKSSVRNRAQKLVIRAREKTATTRNLLHLTHAKDTSKRTRIAITDNTKKNTKSVTQKVAETSVIARSQMQLALLTPFRFPMPREQFVGSVARYAGVFFVVVGGFFSLINLPYANGTFLPQQAETYSAITTTTVSTTDGGMLAGTDIKPEPKIFVEGGDTISSIVPITLTVPHASEVKVILSDKDTGKLIPLGSAVKIDPLTWRYYWKTTDFHDGEYRIKSVIKNSYGTYDYSDVQNYTVFNTPIEVVNTTTSPDIKEKSSTDNTVTNTDVPVSVTRVSTIPKVALKMIEESSTDDVVFLEADSAGALDVKMYARNIKTGAFLYLGYAKKIEDARWTLAWKTYAIPAGEYLIHAKARIDGKEYESVPVTKSIEADDSKSIENLNTVIQESELSLAPTITLEIPNQKTFSGFVSMSVISSPVLSVEMFILPENSLTARSLGRAQKISETSWKYVWDTRQSPNGEYSIYAQVKSIYGFTEGDRESVRVFNYATETFTEEQESKIDTLQTIKDSLVYTTDIDTAGEEVSTTFESEGVFKSVYIKPVSSYIKTIEVEKETQDVVRSLLNDFRAELKNKLSELARAKRNGDADLLMHVQEDIEELKKAVIEQLPKSIEKQEIIQSINAYLDEVSSKLQELTIKNEKILAGRNGDDILKDSDMDGITDYDEFNLYQTNPFSADTDSDGYIDGAEITLGYNPNDSRSEAFMTYESPKEVGIIREDILTIDSITTLTNDENSDVVVPHKAFITGKGLPNSFVTLYVFSTPIVVTVKTDAEGGWAYVFDKELEEGAHEVYVGITDNTGQIVAKSNPLSFVKTAEAFTVTDTPRDAVEETVEDTSLLSSNAMLLIASIAIVALGLILILLGLHVHGRKTLLGEIQPA